MLTAWKLFFSSGNSKNFIFNDFSEFGGDFFMILDCKRAAKPTIKILESNFLIKSFDYGNFFNYLTYFTTRLDKCLGKKKVLPHERKHDRIFEFILSVKFLFT